MISKIPFPLSGIEPSSFYCSTTTANEKSMNKTSRKGKNPNEAIIFCRLGYPSLFEPTKFSSGDSEDKLRYKVRCMIDRNDEASLNVIREAMNRAYLDKWPTNGPKLGDNSCLKDGAKGENEKNHPYWFVSASNKNRKKIQDLNKREITEADGLVYGGAEAFVYVRFYGFVAGAKAMLSASIEGVCITGGGDPFGAAPLTSEDMFGGIASSEGNGDLPF